MKKISTFLGAVLVVALVMQLSGCKQTPKPLSEIIGRAWVPQTVNHGTNLVYTKGAATNPTPGYSNWRLDLTSPTSVTYREFDGNSFSGQWEVQETGTGNKLILKNLTPQPTGTNGTVEFVINSSSETEFTITRTTSSQKTGGTVNKYALVTP
jgi:hypothetical protein